MFSPDTVINKSFELMSQMQAQFAPTTGLVPDFIVGLPGCPAPLPPHQVDELNPPPKAILLGMLVAILGAWVRIM